MPAYNDDALVRNVLVLLAVVGLFALGCATGPQLKPGAERIRFFNDAPDETQFAYVGEVSCEFGANYQSTGDNMKACRDELRNKALQMGGTTVVITSQNAGAGQCGNCVSMFGSVYRKKQTASASAAAQPAQQPVQQPAQQPAQQPTE